MWETIQGAIEALRDGSLSPLSFVGLVLLGLVVWLSAKTGEGIIKTISNLLSEGSNLRTTLNDELVKAHARTERMQEERDQAMLRTGEAMVESARLQEQLTASNARSSELAQDLIDAHRQLQDMTRQMQDLQARIARTPYDPNRGAA